MIGEDDETRDDEHPSWHHRQNKTHDADQDEPDAAGNAHDLLQMAPLICGIAAFGKFLSTCVFNTDLLLDVEKWHSGSRMESR